MSRIIAAITGAVAPWSNSPGLIRAAVETWLLSMEVPELSIGTEPPGTTGYPPEFCHRHTLECNIPFGCGLYANKLHIRTDGKGKVEHLVKVQFEPHESLGFDLLTHRFDMRIVGVTEPHKDIVEDILWCIVAFLETEQAEGEPAVP